MLREVQTCLKNVEARRNAYYALPQILEKVIYKLHDREYLRVQIDSASNTRPQICHPKA